MLLYHSTNVFSAERMLKYGMGLDMSDYSILAKEIAKTCKTPVNIFDNILDGIKNDGEANGGVSFMPTMEQALKLDHLGRCGGEWRGSIVRAMLKRVARYHKVKYEMVKHHINTFTGGDTPSCIVTVDLPVEFIVNKAKIGKGVELYTNVKVFPMFILGYEIYKE